MVDEGKITLEEHYKLGKLLRIASDKLIKVTNEIKPKIKARDSNESKALKLINNLRNILEEIMVQDYGKEGDEKFKHDWWQNVYYGKAGRK